MTVEEAPQNVTLLHALPPPMGPWRVAWARRVAAINERQRVIAMRERESGTKRGGTLTHANTTHQGCQEEEEENKVKESMEEVEPDSLITGEEGEEEEVSGE